MKTVNKNDIIDMIIARTGEKKDLTTKMVNETLTALRKILSSSKEETRISLHDFGVFEVRQSNPHLKMGDFTSKEPIIMSRKNIVFVPGQFLKNALKETNEG